MSTDYLIVGGGVIGMMLARELAQAGGQVKLVERGLCAQESSWAGGGIVSPLYPWRYKAPVTALASWSQGFYPQLAEQLLAETGIDPELIQKGLLLLRVEDEAWALDWAQAFKRPLQRVEAGFLYDKEPRIAPGFEQAIWMPEVGSIRNPRLGQALRKSLQQHPRIELIEHTEVNGLLVRDGRVFGVRTRNAVLSAGHVILTTGAWTGGLLEPLGLRLPVTPVKGQMILFKAPVGLLNRVVLLDGRYVIPRRDGRILAGSTLERVGFDKTTTEEALASLRESAYQILPDLKDYEIEHHWAGLRPGSPEGIPYIGQVPGIRGLYVNAGQFRNGLVLAPASTRLLADLLLAREPIIDPAPYRLDTRIEMV